MAYYPPVYNRNFYGPMPVQGQPMAEYVPQYQHTHGANDMLWVLNEAEATAYPVAPNNSVVLWDKNNPTIYVKSVNLQGVPSMRVLEFTERTADPPKHECTCGDRFVAKSDFDDLKAEFERLREKVEAAKTAKSKKTEVDE